ncbi:MAG: hypothetical protein R3B54_13975 [Bdellovibrionota bacterium]
MFRQKLTEQKAVALKPFALRIRDGYLIGLALEPDAGAPCANCVESWLHDRNIRCKPADLESLKGEAKAALNKAVHLNSAHTFFEIMDNGQKNKLECIVFPHPRCLCRKEKYCPPVVPKKGAPNNLAFSPIFQLKSVRYGTPNGNLWFFTAMGQAPLTMKIVAAHAAASDKDQARRAVIDLWLKKSALLELDLRLRSGETFRAWNLKTQDEELVASEEELDTSSRWIGAGASEEEATVEALCQWAKQQTLEEYSNLGKSPMLVVGANNWLRGKVPFFLIQQYDLYPLFYPNKSAAWVVGLAAFSRLSSEEKPVFAFGADGNIGNALDKAIFQILEHCRPVDWRKRSAIVDDKKKKEKAAKLNLWWTNWIYRCPKISLKDVLQLEPTKATPGAWQSCLREYGVSMSAVNINSLLLPASLRSLVKLNIRTEGDKSYTRAANVRGIGTWSTLRRGVDPLA